MRKVNPSYSYREYVGCASKVGYRTLKECRKGAERLSYRFGGAVPVHAYLCRYCGKYHLTTSEKHRGGKYDDRVF